MRVRGRPNSGQYRGASQSPPDKILPTQVNLDAKVSLELLVTQVISHVAMAAANGEDVSDSTITRH